MPFTLAEEFGDIGKQHETATATATATATTQHHIPGLVLIVLLRFGIPSSSFNEQRLSAWAFPEIRLSLCAHLFALEDWHILTGMSIDWLDPHYRRASLRSQRQAF